MQGERVRGHFERTNEDGEVVASIDVELEQTEYNRVMRRLGVDIQSLLSPNEDPTQTSGVTSSSLARRDLLQDINSTESFKEMDHIEGDVDFDVVDEDVSKRSSKNDNDSE